MDFHTLSPEETLKELHSNAGTGLSSKNAEKRLKQYGYNSMPEPRKKGLLSHFFAQFADFMILVLVIAAGVSFLASMLEGKMNLVDPLIILAIIILNACLGVFQEHKAEQSLEALKKLSAPDATVLRDGKTMQIPAKNLVPGDIIYLEAGSFVPADARLLSDVLLKADESALTGESVPIEKHTNAVFQPDTPMAERTNLVYSSSVITSGRGTAVVTHTGLSTQIGTIAQMIMEDNAPATPLQKKLSQTGKILGIAALCICVIIFILGVLGKRPVLDMFLTSVSLAVAAIPEGLPSIVTIMLSIGVQRMAKNNAVIRKLPVVETLGNATVICSDKTGTLTQNKMTVTKLYTKEGEEDFTSSIGTLALSLGVLCNNSHTANTEFGDPMELALLSAAEKNNIYPSRLRSLVRRQGEFPFDSTRKCMTVICFSGSIFPEILRQEKYISITKGAPDVLLPRCTHYYENGRLKPLSRDIYQKLLHYNQAMASKALRVIAITCRPLASIPADNTPNQVEKNLVFMGLFGLLDPPRPEAAKAVQTCKHAGIQTIMITGDHLLTARAIGEQVGIPAGSEESITGTQLDALSDEELQKNVNKYRIYARVSPTHKVRVVTALQNQGNVVAMTGDGVNDAPALKMADIGCAMGNSGTDVAKNAADMILMDDNFSTIVEAVREGRGIYDNIRKAIHFLLSSNIGELMTIFTAILFGLSIPLLPVQLLWINLITDSLPAISLGMEPPEKAIMRRPPTPKNKTLFSDGLGLKIISEGLMIGSLALIAYVLGCKQCTGASLSLGRTMCFGVLSLSQLFHAFNMKSLTDSLFQIKITNNPKLIFSFLICSALLVLVISIPLLANIFQVTPLSLPQWLLVFFLSFLPIIIVELQKKIQSAS